jgi:lysozyme
MRTSGAGVNMTAGFEGFVGHPYRDAVGVWTIGFGHTGPDVQGMGTITRAQGLALLHTDLRRFEAYVNGLVKVPLSQDQFDALVDLVYNIGAGAFASSTLLRLLNAKDYRGAQAQFLVWDHAGGHVLPGLLARRRREASLFGSRAPVSSPLARRIAKWTRSLRIVRAKAAQRGWTLALRRRGRELKRDIARAERRAA